jgi:ankyrin repeat protein
VRPEGRCLTVALALLCTATAWAEDEDRALASVAGPGRAALPWPRTQPVEALEWERRLRAPDRFGPPHLRQADLALLAAVRLGSWAEALNLLKSGDANPNARDAMGAHALVPAARAGQDDLVREFIKRGADIDRPGDDGFTALGAAAFAGRRSTVRLLLLAGADLTRWGATGQTAFHLASLAGQLDVLDEMLRQKAPIEILNRQRESPLDVAANAGQLDAVDRLLQAGADPQLAGRR